MKLTGTITSLGDPNTLPQFAEITTVDGPAVEGSVEFTLKIPVAPIPGADAVRMLDLGAVCVGESVTIEIAKAI